MLNIEELKHSKSGSEYKEGYRIVYFFEDGSYDIGEYCKTVEGFMVGLASDPVLSESEIPPFVSYDDLLKRSLEYVSDAKECALYNVDGTLVYKISNNKKSIN